MRNVLLVLFNCSYIVSIQQVAKMVVVFEADFHRSPWVFQVFDKDSKWLRVIFVCMDHHPKFLSGDLGL